MRRLGYVLLAIGMTGLAQAQTPPPVRDPGERLHREQLEKARERVLERGEAEIEIPDAGADTFGDTPELLPEPGPVFQIRAISRQDEVLLDERIFRQIVAPFEGKPLGVNRINLLLDRLNRALVAAGYITSRAYVASRNLSDGELVIAIVPGRIESIRYNGRDVSSGEAGFGVRLALPIRGGDILRLPDIEQAVDQLNRLRRNNVQIQIKPGARPGGSLVELINVQSDSARYQLTGDNQGAPGTGRFRLRTDVETGDMLGLMESLSVGLTSSMETNAVYGAFSLPLGYHTLSFMSSWSEYQNLIGHTALVHGISNSYALTLHRIIHRDQRTKTAMDLTISRRQSERHVNNVRLTPQTQTTARIGLNRLTRARIGTAIGQWTLDAGITRGLSWFGADRDPSDMPAGAARSRFIKYEAAASASLPVLDGYIWRSRMGGQWSRHPLYSSEQIFAGGVSSVRGFPESAQGGDRGFVLRNEIARGDLPPLLGGRLRAEPYLFIDAGMVKTLADDDWARLLGAGLGARVGARRGSAEILAGWPLARPPGLSTGSGPRINFNITYQF